MRPQSRNDFKIAIVCALSVEFDAVEALFDEHYDAYGKQQGDPNFYRTGRIHEYNVVLVPLPEMGKRNASAVASSLKISFPGINLTLLVGICGGVPFPSADTEIILGDVIISSSVAEYDFGRLYPDGFKQRNGFTETLGRADRDIRNFLSALKTQRLQNEIQEKYSNHLTHLKNLDKRWQYPGTAQDRLFEATYRHKHQHQTQSVTCICTDCESSEDPICGEALESDCNKLGCTEKLIKRNRLTTSNPSPRIHFGPLGSGDTVMKSGEHRDKLAQAGIIGFEMEGVGICDSLRCVIIKGVCDYADSHKNKVWQEYAAATAASCTKALLEVIWETMQEGEDQHCLGVENLRPQARVLVIEEYPEDSLNQTLQTDTPSIPTDSSTNGQAVYQWELSSRTSSIDNIAHHIRSLEEELRRLKKNVSNPILRKVLVSGVAEAVKRNSDVFRSRETAPYFNSTFYDTRFGRMVRQTRVIKQSTTAYGKSSIRYKTTTSFIFHPASWIIRIGLKYGIEASTVNSQTGWQYSISPVRAVQKDALIFQFCEAGNIDAVHELFKRGDASVLDIDSRGWMPLHFATNNGHIELTKYLILQGADRMARLYRTKPSYIGRFTPALLINFRHGKVLDMLSLFDDCIDFDGPMADGWTLAETINDYCGYDNRVAYELLSALFRKFRTESIDNIDVSSIRYCLDIASRSDIETARLILDFDPKAANDVDWVHEKPRLHVIASSTGISVDFMKVLLDRGADIHVVDSGETATSASLWFSKTFFHWLKRLEVIYQELDGFIERETSPRYVLIQDGWCHDTLLDLLRLKPTEEHNYAHTFHLVSCDGCSARQDTLYNNLTIIEPWWEELKYRVKNKQCICSLLAGSHFWVIGAEDQDLLSLCRSCRDTSSSKPQDDSTCHTAKLDPDDDFDTEDNHSDLGDHQCSRRGKLLSSLENFFYLQNGKWNGEYSPGEYYCFNCLAQLEGWGIYYCFEGWEIGSHREMSDEEDTDTETSDEEDSDVRISDEDDEEDSE